MFTPPNNPSPPPSIPPTHTHTKKRFFFQIWILIQFVKKFTNTLNQVGKDSKSKTKMGGGGGGVRGEVEGVRGLGQWEGVSGKSFFFVCLFFCYFCFVFLTKNPYLKKIGGGGGRGGGMGWGIFL